MTCATHTQLSEPSVSEHMHAHDGKGREGNGKGSGGEARGETPHHGVAYLTREAHDAMMTGDRS